MKPGDDCRPSEVEAELRWLTLEAREVGRQQPRREFDGVTRLQRDLIAELPASRQNLKANGRLVPPKTRTDAMSQVPKGDEPAVER